MQAASAQEKLVKEHTFEKDWGEADRREKRVGNWREFQDDPESKKARAASYKEEARVDVKHGVVKGEEWKKKWK
jgi:hypothetical protein